MIKIIIKDVSKSYPHVKNIGQEILVLNQLNLCIKAGEFITFFGPNGCGKTTLLNVIAGTESFNYGKILIDSKTPEQARTGLVFQNYSDSLMPWLTCRQNILYPFTLKKRKHELNEAKERLDKYLSFLDLDFPIDNYPYQVSGGQQQLTSILRTLIYEPDVILMDEPFSSLDYQTREIMQAKVLDLWAEEKQTILFVSHEIEEAIFLADRLVLLESLPTKIANIIDIPFVRPRTHALLEADNFFHLKRHCLNMMRKTR